MRLLHYGFPSPRSTCRHSPSRGSCPTFPVGSGRLCRVSLAQPGWLCSFSSWCAWFSASWLSFQGPTLPFGALSPQQLCCATSDRLLRPRVPPYLPARLRDQWCFTGAPPSARQLCPWSLAGPSGQDIVPYWPCGVSLPGVLSPRTAAPCHLKGAFRIILPQTLRAVRKPP